MTDIGTDSPPGCMGVAGNPDDARVIAESRDDPERFGLIFDRYFATIHRYARMRLGESLAEEIAAEVFYVAFRLRERYDLGLPDARPWLYGIATNLVHQHRRTEIRRYQAYARAARDDAAAIAADSHEERVTERVSVDSVWPELAAGLARLPAPDRDVLLLVAAAQLSYEEVARALGIPAGTVGSRLSRARRRVRSALGGIDPTLARGGKDEKE